MLYVDIEEIERRHYTNHWEEDCSDEMLLDYASDDMAIEAMKYWLMLWKGFDEDRLLELFECVSLNKQCEILKDYIDGSEDRKAQFDNWYENRYSGDEEDREYEIARDMGRV